MQATHKYKTGHCCDNELSVIETADKFKMC